MISSFKNYLVRLNCFSLVDKISDPAIDSMQLMPTVRLLDDVQLRCLTDSLTVSLRVYLTVSYRLYHTDSVIPNIPLDHMSTYPLDHYTE